MVELTARRYDSFLVRILSQQHGIVQGQITHVASRQTLRFRDLQEALRFIEGHLGAPEASAQAREGGESR